MGLLALVGVGAVGVVLRVLDLDVMEFKYDEVTALQMAERCVAGDLPLHGLTSGVGGRNPPGFIYLLALPLALGVSTLGIGVLVALANVAGVFVLAGVGRRMAGMRVGLGVALLAATHPWLVLFSRKIWAQSLLPLAMPLFLWCWMTAHERERSRAIVWALPLLALMLNLHYSALAPALVFGGWLAVALVRRRVHVPMLVCGALLALAMMVPFLVHLGSTGFRDVSVSVDAGAHGPGLGSLLVAAHSAFAMCHARGLGAPFVFGPAALAAALPGRLAAAVDMAALLSTVAVMALAVLGVRSSQHEAPGAPGHRSGRWLAAYALAPLLFCGLAGVTAPPHYFIIATAPLLLLAARGAGRLSSGPGAAALLLALAGVGTAAWLLVLSTIRTHGGTGGDYGLAYRIQTRAAAALAADGVRSAELDGRWMRDQAVGVCYLLDRMPSPKTARATAAATPRVLLVDTLIYPDALRADAPPVGIRWIGPLAICELGGGSSPQ
jgi:hypothetical protein